MFLPKNFILSLFCLIALVLNTSAQEGNAVVRDSNYIYRNLKEARLNPEAVYRLNLSKSRLDTFPADILLFHNLRELDLSKNRLASLPEEIGQLRLLERLNLSNNKLDSLPEEIGELSNLVYLGLNRNILESLPASIGKLQKLEVLELWDNELADVPDEIANLSNLKVLELRGILFSDEQQARIDSLVVKTAKIFMSPSCACKN
ncbi:MAG TPA: leucine-rich repeat domain-containing protein [Bacteroidia bacterium]|nr:leucine-rich repeat domain-containing protein [Bacteroidia bacterium]